MISKLFCVILSAFTPFFFLTPSASAADAETLREIAESVTVKILECRRDPVEQEGIIEPKDDSSKLCFEGEPSFRQVGSGTIVGSQGDTYYILTAQHVVKSIAEQAPYAAISFGTSELSQLDLVRDKMGVPLIWESDLALLSFKTKENLIPATLYTGCVVEEWSQLSIPVEGAFPFSMLCQSLEQALESEKPVTEMPQILVFGHPLSEEESAQPLLSLGTFIDRDSTSLELQTPVAGGYEFLYNAVTEKGMSGGPILDTDGRLIGIHGVTDGDPISELSFGYGLGIPIDFFLRQLVSALSTDYDLTFVTPETLDLLPQEGQNSVVVASINGSYYIKIFDRNGKVSVGPKQISFYNDPAFVRKLDSAFVDQSLDRQSIDEILSVIAKELGYVPSSKLPSGSEFVSASTVPSDLSLEDISILLGGNPSNCSPATITTAGSLFMEYGSRLVRLGKYNEALRCFDLARSIYRSSPLPLYGSGTIFLRLATQQKNVEQQRENLTRAKILFEEAIEIAADSTLSNRQQYLFRYNLGRTLNQLGKYEEAVQVFEQAINDYRPTVLYSEYLQAWAAKAIALNELGRAEEAAKAQYLAGSDLAGYGAAISRGNGLYESAIQKIREGSSLIEAREMLHDADDAFGEAEKKRSPSTSTADIWLGKSKVQTALENYEEAKTNLERSIQNGNAHSLETLEVVFEIASTDFENSFEWGRLQVRKALENNETNYAAFYFDGLFFSIDHSMTNYLSRYEAAYQSCNRSVLINNAFQPAVECRSRMRLIVEDIQFLQEKCETLFSGRGRSFGQDFEAVNDETLPPGDNANPFNWTDGVNFRNEYLLGGVTAPSGSTAGCRVRTTRRTSTPVEEEGISFRESVSDITISSDLTAQIVDLNLVQEND